MGLKITKKIFLILFTLIVILSFFMRIYLLDAKPMHHDEGVLDYYYVGPLLENYSLDYLGIEYHGLAFHFLAYPFIKILGLSLFSLRLSVAVFGTLTVWLIYFLKDYIGKTGVLFSSAFLAISPISVYYSRQYTGYPFLIFLLLLLIILVLKYLKEFRNYQLYLMAIVLAIISNINEIFFVFLFISFTFFYLKYLFDKSDRSKEFLRKIKWKHIIFAILTFMFVLIMIHTNFFFNFQNLGKLTEAVSHVSDKAVSTGHNKSFTYYFKLLFPYELGLLVMGLIGLLFFKRDSFTKYILFWSLGSIFIFSLISYKTNWMVPLIIFPLILNFGNTLDYLVEKLRFKTIILIVGILLILVSSFYSIQQNYIYYDDFDRNKIGYVETSQEVNELLDDIGKYAQNKRIHILITANGYWPLPSYLRTYKLKYLTSIKEINLTKYDDYDVFISDKSQIPDLPKSITKEEYEFRKGYRIFALYKN
jgi:uncharacterized protein (TIGR03663 family)